MQKTALYRKYRPLTFSDVHGQDHVTVPLRRQIASGAPSHAYLFTGTRGTGKTTCAKIFSRAVNCLDPKDGEPCNECSVCKGILDGSIYDVYEIDAASNTGVENIREIREDIAYAPITAKYKIYIIDEVHMLSTGAFNALLKTLEEPPEHVIFILATTEPHKVPATILSRCQRFDFFRLSVKKITEILDSVLEKEGRTLDRSSVALVADLADGSVRDALSILDRVLELDSAEEIERSLGVIGRTKLYEAARSIAAGDTDDLYRLIGEMYSASADMTVFTDELTEVFRRILAAKSSSRPESVIDASEEDIAKIRELAPLFTEQFLIYAMKTLRQTRLALSRGADPRPETEICMLMLAKPSLSEDLSSLTARMEAVERSLEALKNMPVSARPARPVPPPDTSSVQTPESRPAAPEKKAEPEPQQEPVQEAEKKPEEDMTGVPEAGETETDDPVQPVTGDGGNVPDTEWREFLTLGQIADRIKDMSTRMLLKTYAKAVYRNNEVIIMTGQQSDVSALKKNIDLIRAAFDADHKPGRIISIECGEDTSKYTGSTYAYDNLETNPMFTIE